MSAKECWRWKNLKPHHLQSSQCWLSKNQWRPRAPGKLQNQAASSVPDEWLITQGEVKRKLADAPSPRPRRATAKPPGETHGKASALLTQCSCHRGQVRLEALRLVLAEEPWGSQRAQGAGRTKPVWLSVLYQVRRRLCHMSSMIHVWNCWLRHSHIS